MQFGGFLIRLTYGLVLIFPFVFVMLLFAAYIVEGIFKFLAVTALAPVWLVCAFLPKTRGFTEAAIRLYPSGGLTIVFAATAMGFTLATSHSFTEGLIDATEKHDMGLVFTWAYWAMVLLGFISLLLHLKATTLAANISGANDGAGRFALANIARRIPLDVLVPQPAPFSGPRRKAGFSTRLASTRPDCSRFADSDIRLTMWLVTPEELAERDASRRNAAGRSGAATRLPAPGRRRPRCSPQRIQPGGLRCSGQRPVQGRKRQSHAQPELEIQGIVDGEAVLAGKSERRAPYAGCRYRVDLDGQRFQAGAHSGPLVGAEAAALGRCEQHAPDLDRPEGGDEGAVVDEGVPQPGRRLGCLVGEHPRHGDGAVEDEGHQYLRASSTIRRTDSPP
ncbi:MAG: hypothetical protein OXI22_10110, partial [Defluviicoccus sp.]|nr:hypothetical protein [Defluviicoccus sp.]